MLTWFKFRYMIKNTEIYYPAYLSSAWPNTPDWQAWGGALIAHLPTPPQCISSTADRERECTKLAYMIRSWNQIVLIVSFNEWIKDAVVKKKKKVLSSRLGYLRKIFTALWIKKRLLLFGCSFCANSSTNSKIWSSWMRDQNHFNSHCAFNAKQIPHA